MNYAVLKALNAAYADRRAVGRVVDLATGEERLVDETSCAADPLAGPLAEQMRKGKSALIEHEGARYFLTVHQPPAKVVMIGAVHISQALMPLVRLLGHEPVIVDPRTAFASVERFPGVKLLAQWPEVALPELGIDRYTALVALAHDPKIDDPAIEYALSRQCFYVGALGSRKTHAGRVERLQARGIPDAAIARIHAPIGLDIGAVSAAEIAVAIIAEITAALRIGSGEKAPRTAA
jgi:xanthine dehydrogenase accessory factor